MFIGGRFVDMGVFGLYNWIIILEGGEKMDELRIVKLAELRGKLGAIPAKLIVTFLLTFGMLWKFHFQTFMEDPLVNSFTVVVIYGVVSYFWLCVRLTHNWLIGIVVAIALVIVVTMYISKENGVLGTVIMLAICFGGVVMDFINMIRYSMLKKKVFRVTADYEGSEFQEDWQQDEDAEEYAQQEDQARESVSAFFSGCKDEASIKRRYKDLCKVYHPDNGNGSADIFNRITEEYNRLMESGVE